QRSFVATGKVRQLPVRTTSKESNAKHGYLTCKSGYQVQLTIIWDSIPDEIVNHYSVPFLPMEI
ncbi:MAG: hypothetical protein ACNA8H_14025, partial [Anaerolineales bacterium]